MLCSISVTVVRVVQKQTHTDMEFLLWICCFHQDSAAVVWLVSYPAVNGWFH
jgi:hypothetical protein